ncbi:hypothetical protein NR798_00505 [Archangium gephyra]|uniref:hypothetical protein n=1 Tax=Archangium gephyra TaxID=48 RepID=UPI0035D50D00
MKQNGFGQPPFPVEILARKSWAAYLMTTCGWGVLLVLIGMAVLASRSIGISLIASCFLAIYVYAILLLRSYSLYCDGDGVWVQSGVLPWKKGVYGVKWCDLDAAVYHQGFSSWLLRSYTIQLRHRFTKSAEILLTHMSCGDKAVARINELHLLMLGRVRADADFDG